ncbi:MAG TPA: NAD(P)H-binding protein [Streptomyces sp.]|nr:NAD(P)H-binding protein [Streptomyces sp.]
MSDKMILVTGGTGKTGRRVVRLLEERGVTARAASRTGAVRFDWADRTTWESALQGVTDVYLVAPDLGGPQAARDIAAFARQAAGAGVRRAVLLSVPGNGGLDHEHVLAAERALGDAGLEWTVLRLRWFFQNFSEDFLLDPVLSDEVRLPAGDGREAFVDAEDIAAVAVAALTEDGHTGQHYELTGPRLMTFADTIAEIAKATGRNIRYVPVDTQTYADEQRAQGVPEEWIHMLTSAYEPLRSGNLASFSNDVERVLGRPARDFSHYARDVAAQGTWTV